MKSQISLVADKNDEVAPHVGVALVIIEVNNSKAALFYESQPRANQLGKANIRDLLNAIVSLANKAFS
jgi:hypothetical protein